MKKLYLMIFLILVVAFLVAACVTTPSQAQGPANQTVAKASLCRGRDLAVLRPVGSYTSRDVVHLTALRMRYENLFWDEQYFAVKYKLVQCKTNIDVTLTLSWHDWLGKGHVSVIGRSDSLIEPGRYGFKYKWKRHR